MLKNRRKIRLPVAARPNPGVVETQSMDRLRAGRGAPHKKVRSGHLPGRGDS